MTTESTPPARIVKLSDVSHTIGVVMKDPPKRLVSHIQDEHFGCQWTKGKLKWLDTKKKTGAVFNARLLREAVHLAGLLAKTGEKPDEDSEVEIYLMKNGLIELRSQKGSVYLAPRTRKVA